MLLDARYFTHPKAHWQRRYEAVRASFVERLAAKVVADRFGYAPLIVQVFPTTFESTFFWMSYPNNVLGIIWRSLQK